MKIPKKLIQSYQIDWTMHVFNLRLILFPPLLLSFYSIVPENIFCIVRRLPSSKYLLYTRSLYNCLFIKLFVCYARLIKYAVVYKIGKTKKKKKIDVQLSILIKN